MKNLILILLLPLSSLSQSTLSGMNIYETIEEGAEYYTIGIHYMKIADSLEGKRIRSGICNDLIYYIQDSVKPIMNTLAIKYGFYNAELGYNYLLHIQGKDTLVKSKYYNEKEALTGTVVFTKNKDEEFGHILLFHYVTESGKIYTLEQNVHGLPLDQEYADYRVITDLGEFAKNYDIFIILEPIMKLTNNKKYGKNNCMQKRPRRQTRM